MDVSETSFETVREIKAAVEEVFAAWTDPELMAQWLAPAPLHVLAAEVDARAGGRYRIEVMSPDGQITITTGEYQEFNPPHRLVKTWNYEDPTQPGEMVETLLTVELREIETGVTELTLRHVLITKALYQAVALKGWMGCLDKLTALCESGQIRIATFCMAA